MIGHNDPGGTWCIYCDLRVVPWQEGWLCKKCSSEEADNLRLMLPAPWFCDLSEQFQTLIWDNKPVTLV